MEVIKAWLGYLWLAVASERYSAESKDFHSCLISQWHHAMVKQHCSRVESQVTTASD